MSKSGKTAQGGKKESPNPAFGLIILAFFVIGAIVTTIIGLAGGIGPKDTPTKAPPPLSITTPGKPTGDVCTAYSRDTAIPGVNFAAEPFVWSGDIELAHMDGVGPCSNIDGIPAKYAPTPSGALIAAINYSVLVTIGGEQTSQAIAHLSVPGPQTDALVAYLADHPQRRAAPMTLHGFTIYAVSEKEYLVSLAIELEGDLVAWNLTAQWIDEDWRIMPMPVDTGWDMRYIASMSSENFFAWTMN